VLEGEEQEDVEEEEQRELEQKFARRQLGSNADRYVEPEPELDSEGEAVAEPEVDLSSFLERQRISDGPSSSALLRENDEDDDVDHSLSHLIPTSRAVAQSKKGKVQAVEWDAELEELRQEKAAAEAKWDLKARFRASAVSQRGKPNARGNAGRGKARERTYVEAPPLPTETPKPDKTEKAGMEEFLDDLLG